MKILLAAATTRKFLLDEFHYCDYFLESFYSMEDWLLPVAKQSKMFLLDSGAFTFMNSKKNETTDFDEYTDRYIDYINRNNIEYFFEMDVDVVVGLKEVERLRAKLEAGTGRQCIPVWHKDRGKDYFVGLCKDYDYISIGGIVTKEITPADYKYFHWLIDTAHCYGCQIHGLGFTNLKGLYEYNFDSVDSTAWLSGGRFGTLYHFNGRRLLNVDTDNRRRREDISHEGIDRHNYYEWVKFQRFADAKL